MRDPGDECTCEKCHQLTEGEIIEEVRALKKVYGRGEHPAFFPEFGP